MKFLGSTLGLHPILLDWSNGEVSGILGVAVKCVDIERKTDGESNLLDIY